MRITVIEFAPSGGLYQFNYQLGRALAERGHQVDLLTGPEPELTADGDGFTVRPQLRTWHPMAAGVEPWAWRKLRRVVRAGRHLDAWRRVGRDLRRSSPDAVVMSAARFAVDGWIVDRLARRRERPRFACIAHEPRPLSEQRQTGSLYRSGALLLRSLGRGFAAVDVVFVLGESARRELVDQWPGVRNVAVIPHGDEHVFAQREIRPADQAPPTILFFGTWTRYKGLDVLLDAFADVRDRLPDARLVVAGAIVDVDLSGITAHATRVGGVELRPGYVPLSQVQQLFEDARVVALPYLRANQSGVAHLAQTFARPVVAAAVGDIPAAVQDGVNGLLVPPGDRRALARALERLLNFPADAARMGAAGRERVAVDGSWQRVAAAVEQALLALPESDPDDERHRSSPRSARL